jgi:hypothetical protein
VPVSVWKSDDDVVNCEMLRQVFQTKNPLTFRDIDPTQASLHSGIPRNPVIGTVANQVHNAGSVWCAALWEARANMVVKHGFGIGNQLILQLVTDGMKLSPANPNFLQARDAIIQADLVNNAGANRSELWAAFAKRGMGASATAPSSATMIGVVQSFDLPDDLGVSPSSEITASGPVGGWVAVRARRAASSIRISVEDNGPGVANPDNLFVPFFTTKPGGSGIGLVLARQVAEAHGGTLTLKNRDGTSGCIARLVIPT